MYPTYGAHQITSVTELRQDTIDIIDHAKRTGEAILVQRNNDPIAILLSVATYTRYLAIREAFLEAQSIDPRDEPGEPPRYPALSAEERASGPVDLLEVLGATGLEDEPGSGDEPDTGGEPGSSESGGSESGGSESGGSDSSRSSAQGDPARPLRPDVETTRFSVDLTNDTLERLRNMSYWERVPLYEIIEMATVALLDVMEGINGEPYPPRRGTIRGGDRTELQPWAYYNNHFDRLRTRMGRYIRRRLREAGAWETGSETEGSPEESSQEESSQKEGSHEAASQDNASQDNASQEDNLRKDSGAEGGPSGENPS
jgi:PHD/YefM family antitoxin component YafN of YafNO toxin-antitoxin module